MQPDVFVLLFNDPLIGCVHRPKITGSPNQSSRLREGWKNHSAAAGWRSLNGWSRMSHGTHITHSALLHPLSYLILQKRGWKQSKWYTHNANEWCLLILKLACFLEKSVMVPTYNLSYLGGWGCKTASTASSQGFKAILGTHWDLVTKTNKTFSGYGHQASKKLQISFKRQPKRNRATVFK